MLDQQHCTKHPFPMSGPPVGDVRGRMPPGLQTTSSHRLLGLESWGPRGLLLSPTHSLVQIQFPFSGRTFQHPRPEVWSPATGDKSLTDHLPHQAAKQLRQRDENIPPESVPAPTVNMTHFIRGSGVSSRLPGPSPVVAQQCRARSRSPALWPGGVRTIPCTPPSDLIAWGADPRLAEPSWQQGDLCPHLGAPTQTRHHL